MHRSDDQRSGLSLDSAVAHTHSGSRIVASVCCSEDLESAVVHTHSRSSFFVYSPKHGKFRTAYTRWGSFMVGSKKWFSFPRASEERGARQRNPLRGSYAEWVATVTSR